MRRSPSAANLLLGCLSLGLLTLLAANPSVPAPGTALTGLSDHAGRDDVPLGPGKRVGLVAASFPWTFGPYQSQMYLVSVYLHEVRGLDIFWLCIDKGSAVPVGEFNDYAELRRRNPDITVVHPPAGFGRLDHLTFAGTILSGQHSKYRVASNLNALAERYRLDALMLLSDITNVLPTVEFEVPVLGWFPLHTHGPVRRAQYDYWVLRHFHALAALSPSSLRDMWEGLSDDTQAGTITLDLVPHVIDGGVLRDCVKSAGERLRMTAQDPDPKRRQKEKRLRQFLRSRLGRDDVFVAHSKGGNYDTEDRKGWGPGLQAYKRFYDRVQDAWARDPTLPPVHLYIHSIPSYLIQMDGNDDKEPPAALMPLGMNLRYRTYDLGLPEEAYTLDETIYDRDTVAFLQAMGSVCLLPSRVEGFGMNNLECQAVGTPVVTTNHTATGDYCHWGRAVPPKQYYFSSVSMEFADPDVAGIAEALWELYVDHAARLEERQLGTDDEETSLSHCYLRDKQDAMDWIDDGFSMERVGGRIFGLLQAAARNFAARQALMEEHAEEVRRNKYGVYDGERAPLTYAVVNGTHVDYIDWDADIRWVIISPPGVPLDHDKLRFLAWQLLSIKEPLVYILPAEGVEFKTHMDAFKSPIMVRTFYFSALHLLSTRRDHLTQLALTTAQPYQNVQRLNF